ncbi:uncharacterized protein B4U79_05766 [Dinothrombium tinctorium]|uniref:DRBM domain-containing protein n=1 Tax=Dinothrombium tinctorium TaxID=1965070 RepID=A0A3S3PV48_9ACAR|nr:uncharacterized protein B4U79_05766 [Dinothrombium tinctorium]
MASSHLSNAALTIDDRSPSSASTAARDVHLVDASNAVVAGDHCDAMTVDDDEEHNAIPILSFDDMIAGNLHSDDYPFSDLANGNSFVNEPTLHNCSNNNSVDAHCPRDDHCFVGENSSSMNCGSNSDSDIPIDDIDDMLEEGLKQGMAEEKRKPVHSSIPPHEERKKIRDQDYFEMLPEGWVEVTHFSGMPVYLHKQSRVCTMSKPYYLGPGSARKHEIPISAIPCLEYRRELEKERLQENNKRKREEEIVKDEIKIERTNTAEDVSQNTVNGQESSKIIAKVESVQDNKKEKSLNYMDVRNYCKQLFEFQEITIRKFKTWADRRRHMQIRKMQQRPSLPEGTKLITCPLPKKFVMNPAGKSAVCILHEFVQHAERVQPKYVFKELENASMPYSATVIIGKMEYGVGYGSSKKQAKSDAARATLEILIPDMKDITQGENKKIDTSMQDLSFFDDIKIEDQRVSELCAKAGQHSPYQILVECLRRNCGMGDTDISTSVRLVKHQKNEFTMRVGNHSATVLCRNKREGKQRAAQAILKLLHPQINSWGSLLRLYGRGSCKTPKEKKEEEQKITELQNTASANRPNYAILKKLKEEMIKLKKQKIDVGPTMQIMNNL